MLSDLLRKSVKFEANEVRATLVSFSFVLVLMAAYYILRPVRDAMASDWTDAEVSWLWTLNFFISAVVVSVYGGAVTSVTVRSTSPRMFLACLRSRHRSSWLAAPPSPSVYGARAAPQRRKRSICRPRCRQIS